MPRNVVFYPQADEGKLVLAAGDPERAHTDKVKKEGGITYHINQIKDSVSSVLSVHQLHRIISLNTI